MTNPSDSSPYRPGQTLVLLPSADLVNGLPRTLLMFSNSSQSIVPRFFNNAEKTHSNAELLGRIERLESIILRQVPVENHSKYISDDSHLTRSLVFNPSLEGIQRQDEDSQLLENIGTREDSLLSCLSDGLAFRIGSTHQILGSQIGSGGDRPSTTVVTLPVYRIAVLLFQSYESYADHMYRIIHVPTVRAFMKTLYLRINQSESILPSQAALLLSIFAFAAFFYQPFGNSEVATTEQETIHLSKNLSKSALDVLDHSRRDASGTLEDIQAYIIMSLVTYHLDGYSARGRLLSTAAASIARDLRLHQLDAYNESSLENETRVSVLIDREVKRRVFWYITSNDWLMSTISGPQEGIYFIHPNHVDVRLPKNCTDDDIILGKDSQPEIGSQAPGMTFFLEKIRLAHLCREMADIVPLDMCKLMQLPYEKIIALDRKLEDYISTLPFYFRLDAESRKKSKAIEAIYPLIPVLRHCITITAHSRRCKLHHRFLLRQSLDPRYAYSRRACLESARAVVHIYGDLSAFHAPQTKIVRMGMAVRFIHFAMVVMVMDLCFNKDQTDGAEIKSEVKAALQKFESVKEISPLLSLSVSSLNSILQKHKVFLFDTTTTNEIVHKGTPNVFNTTGDNQMQSAERRPDVHEQSVALDTSFDQFWQFAVESEPNLDSLAWDNFFSALDTQPM
ncbi:hypothetical protein B7494_g7197 [Chlorociboria aeruginascens]|nr:hypothetical protein B7494_g7197 [Chlorociboria aeruginascens]